MGIGQDGVRVLGRHLAKVCLDDGRVGAGVEAVLVSAGTEVLLALGDHGIVYALRSLALV